MSGDRLVQTFDSLGAAYHRAFAVFLKNTDQKLKTRAWLDEAVRQLGRRHVFIDAGAGTGQVTAWYTGQFERTIAIEPNPSLRVELETACGQIDILPNELTNATPPVKGDLVLCSHVLYYIAEQEWLANLNALASWTATGGLLAIILQNPQTDCMRMFKDFTNRSFDLRGLESDFRETHGNDFESRIETVPASITSPDLETAYTIAEFILNLLPLPRPILRDDVEKYLRRHFADSDGGYRLSCDQDILIVRRRA